MGDAKVKKWRFLPNQNSTIVGINDAGIETFMANMNRSLVREMIQNSLDAVLPDSKGPVTVDFSCFEISSEDFPDVESLKSAMLKCKTSNSNEPDAYKFFDNAEKIISAPVIRVLRVSDHNTIGLEGTDTCKKGTSWSRLVKESGSSNKEQGSGGSFGIGKSAAFACSDLRTVFYSSKDYKGLCSNFGVAQLISFEDPELQSWTTGIGYYSEDKRFAAIKELAAFDKNYIRQDSGTDVYIFGIHETDNFKEDIIKAVLLDFLVSLVNNILTVRVQNEVINIKSLPEYINKLNPHDGKEIKDIIEYYRVLTSSHPKIRRIELDSGIYGRKYGFKDGECKLFLMEGEGLNRKIMMTRRAGMRIFEQDRISGSIEFTGVLIINGDNMNEAFKKMEVPSHDAWEPGRCRGEEKYYNKVFEDLRRYLKNTVKECFGKVESVSMDAFGAADFLPDRLAPGNEEKKDPDDQENENDKESEEDEKIKEDEWNKDEGNKKNKPDKMSVRIRSLEGKAVEPVKNESKAEDFIELEPMSEDGSAGSGKGPDPGPEPVPDKPHPGPGPGTEPGSNPGPGPNSGRGGEKPGNDLNYREIHVKKRLICKDAGKGSYLLTMMAPASVAKSRLEFTISGEQSEYNLPVSSAKILSEGNAQIEGIKGNTIYLKNLKKGVSIKLEVNVEFEEYIMMEVKYYAAKK